MPRVNLIGASNLYTNNTCQYGSMPGLAPTTNVRPNISGAPGYKYSAIAANGLNWSSGEALNATAWLNGCGFGRSCADGSKCLKFLGLWNGPHIRTDPVGGKLLN